MISVRVLRLFYNNKYDYSCYKFIAETMYNLLVFTATGSELARVWTETLMHKSKPKYISLHCTV